MQWDPAMSDLNAHEVHHECGVVAVTRLAVGGPPTRVKIDGDDVAPLLHRMLLDLQNRGQLAAGISTYDAGRDQLIRTFKDVGTVAEAFRGYKPKVFGNILAEHRGTTGVGHVRYATCGKDDRANAQPFERHHGCKWKWFAFALNGQLANYNDLAETLKTKSDYHLTRDTDTEIIMHHLSHELRGQSKPDMATVFRNLAEIFDGAYNIVYMNAMGDLAVVRDPLGMRPLCMGRDGDLVAFASESVPLTNLGFADVRSVPPGTVVTVVDGVLKEQSLAPEPSLLPGPAAGRTAHCFFEWIYFANVASTLDERSVYQTRANLGAELAKAETLPMGDDVIVVPVPDTAKAAADAMAYTLGVPSVEGLMRNRYVGRTFIHGAGRAERVAMKYTPLREVLEGRRILLVEDTIVRSTTMRALLSLIRDRGGAAEIHVRVACPPIVAPCFYGIDMSTIGELFAPGFMGAAGVLTEQVQDRMAEALGADSLRYLPIASLAAAIDKPAAALCQACVTGDYPTPKGRALYRIALADRRAGDANGRTYEKKLQPLPTGVG